MRMKSGSGRQAREWSPNEPRVVGIGDVARAAGLTGSARITGEKHSVQFTPGSDGQFEGSDGGNYNTNRQDDVASPLSSGVE